jgi:hypothetical protein
MHLTSLVNVYKKWRQGKITQIARITNLAMLVLMYAFLLHEGGRYGDIQRQLFQEDLVLMLHERVYWLTLVFLPTDLLTKILSSNWISYYSMGMYKGKDKRFVQHRIKSTIPTPYNSLDLLTIYVICMRIILAVDPTSISLNKNVFKTSLNLPSLRHRRTRKTKFADATFYSARYSAAEEDKKGGVDKDIIKKRMGHSKNSLMYLEYSENHDKRATYSGTPIPLGVDIFDNNLTNPQHIPLEFNVVDMSGLVFDSTKIPEDTEVFNSIHKAVKEHIEQDAPLPPSPLPEGDDDWMSQIPLGFNITLPEKMLVGDMSDLFQKYKTALESEFSPVPTPQFIPEIWSFPQIIYGNWRGLVGEPTSNSLTLFKATSKAGPSTQPKNPVNTSRKSLKIQGAPRNRPVDPDDTGVDPEVGDTGVDPDDTGVIPEVGDTGVDPDDTGVIPEVEVHPDDYQNVGVDPDDYDFATILKHDHVVILCSDPNDPCALLLENNIYVWVAKAVQVVTPITKGKEAGKAKFKGWFYFNQHKDITKPIKPKKNQETIVIAEDSIVKVFAAEDDVDFELTEENIQEIKNRF